MIHLTFLFFAATVFGQTSIFEFLQRPHVLPSAERANHAVYHELDSKVFGNINYPIYGLLYVALVEDKFTFGGDLEEWPSSVFHNMDKGCKPFMGTNVHNKCNHTYFLVHQDVVMLRKTVYQRGADGSDPDLDRVCDTPSSGFANHQNSPFPDPDNLIYRYKHRVLMTFKPMQDATKCFGTYDTRTDIFTCMRLENGRLVPFEKQNFLYKPNTGHFWLGSGNVEVFCKEMHYK